MHRGLFFAAQGELFFLTFEIPQLWSRSCVRSSFYLAIQTGATVYEVALCMYDDLGVGIGHISSDGFYITCSIGECNVFVTLKNHIFFY